MWVQRPGQRAWTPGSPGTRDRSNSTPGPAHAWAGEPSPGTKVRADGWALTVTAVAGASGSKADNGGETHEAASVATNTGTCTAEGVPAAGTVSTAGSGSRGS